MIGFPELNIGLGNAWMWMLFYPLQSLMLALADRLVGQERRAYQSNLLPYRRSKRVLGLEKLVIGMMAVYALFLPIKNGTIGFWIGLPIYGIGLAIFLIGMLFCCGLLFGPSRYDPVDASLELHYLEQPIILCSCISFFGLSLAASSWIYLLLTMLLGALVLNVTGKEHLLP